MSRVMSNVASLLREQARLLEQAMAERDRLVTTCHCGRLSGLPMTETSTLGCQDGSLHTRGHCVIDTIDM